MNLFPANAENLTILLRTLEERTKLWVDPFFVWQGCLRGKG
jgi:hypothetical protein